MTVIIIQDCNDYSYCVIITHDCVIITHDCNNYSRHCNLYFKTKPFHTKPRYIFFYKKILFSKNNRVLYTSKQKWQSVLQNGNQASRLECAIKNVFF